jgi:hypothetical protein
MLEPEAEPGAEEAAQESAPLDPALLMRRAIRAVAAAEATVARSLADAARFRSLEGDRLAASIDRARNRADARREIDRHHGETRPEVEGALRVAVGEYVGLMRDAGKAPERAVVHLKQVLRDAFTEELGRVDRADLMEMVVRWGVEAYYRVAPGDDEQDAHRA